MEKHRTLFANLVRRTQAVVQSPVTRNDSLYCPVCGTYKFFIPVAVEGDHEKYRCQSCSFIVVYRVR